MFLSFYVFNMNAFKLFPKLLYLALSLSLFILKITQHLLFHLGGPPSLLSSQLHWALMFKVNCNSFCIKKNSITIFKCLKACMCWYCLFCYYLYMFFYLLKLTHMHALADLYCLYFFLSSIGKCVFLSYTIM